MSNPIYQVGTWYTRDDPFFGIHGFSSSNSAVAYLMHVRNEINAGAVLAECSFKGDLWLGDQKIFSECGFNITIPFCIEANEMKLVEILDLSSARFEYERTYVFESLRGASAALKAMSERLV
jgi:hypothetical protein